MRTAGNAQGDSDGPATKAGRRQGGNLAAHAEADSRGAVPRVFGAIVARDGRILSATTGAGPREHGTFAASVRTEPPRGKVCGRAGLPSGNGGREDSAASRAKAGRTALVERVPDRDREGKDGPGEARLSVVLAAGESRFSVAAASVLGRAEPALRGATSAGADPDLDGIPVRSSGAGHGVKGSALKADAARAAEDTAQREGPEAVNDRGRTVESARAERALEKGASVSRRGMPTEAETGNQCVAYWNRRD